MPSSPRPASGEEESPHFDSNDFREFLLRVCHDLRTPLRSVLAGSEMLQQESLKPSGRDQEQILGFVTDGAKKMESLANGLSALALALGTQPGSFRPAGVDVIVRSVLARLAGPIRESGAQVTYDALPKVTGDPDRIGQLFENLVRNAIEHRGDAAPAIHISAVCDDLCTFAVKDNGPGVEPEYLEKIFRPFERLRRDPSSGPGLGLAICREIVTRHGGKIWAESAPGSGTTIYFTLPAGG